MTHFVGLDVSQVETAICIRDATGGIVWSGKSATEPDAIASALAAVTNRPERVVLETGQMSNWLCHALADRGLTVVCVDARQAHAVLSQMHNKTDTNDAGQLAELARTGFYRKVAVKSRTAQEHRSLIKARDLAIRQRIGVDNTIRSFIVGFGIKWPKEPRRFADRVLAAIDGVEALQSVVKPFLDLRIAIRRTISQLDGRLRALARRDPDCRRLMTVPGVGAVTAFAFMATIDDPTRFRHSRSVGAYVGLTSRRYQSGQRDVSGQISKRGDRTMRTLLYEAASALMTRSKAADGQNLQSWGRALKAKVGHKKATVALARKIAVILHRIWLDGTIFAPPAAREVASA